MYARLAPVAAWGMIREPMDTLDFEEPILELDKKIKDLQKLAVDQKIDLSVQVAALQEQCRRLTRDTFDRLTPWQRIQLARHPQRPLVSDYVRLMVSDFSELHGDRCFRDDPAIVCGLGRIEDRRILLIGNRKGKDTKERMRCNFGMPHPEGYRKAMHKMRLAEKFGLPVVILINTPGAYPGIGAEERGQASVIAENMFHMSALRVPIVCVITGEGFSGGALGTGVADRMLMMENSVFSVISPEGCAAILWKDATKASEAAAILKLTARDMMAQGIADEIIEEPPGGAHRSPEEMANRLRARILHHLGELDDLPVDVMVDQRYQKYRKIGVYLETSGAPVAAAAPVSSPIRRGPPRT